MSITDTTTLTPAQTALAELALARNEMEQAQAKVAEAQAAVLSQLSLVHPYVDGKRRLSLVQNGIEIVGTGVYPTLVSYDSDVIRHGLYEAGRRYVWQNTVSERVLNRSAYETAVKEGKIPDFVVSRARSEKPGTPSVKLTFRPV